MIRFLALLLLMLSEPATAATLVDAKAQPTAACQEITKVGWLCRYTVKAPDNTLGYTQVLVRPTDVIAHKSVPCNAAEAVRHRCQGTKFAAQTNKKPPRVISPGTRDEPVYPKTEADARGYAAQVMVEKEKRWIATLSK